MGARVSSPGSRASSLESARGERRRLRLRRAARGSPRLLRRPVRRHADDRRARRRRRSLRPGVSAAPWTAPSTTSIVTGLYAHHHGYLHWDAALDPAIETLFSRVRRARVRGGELRLRPELPLQGSARGERRRDERDARRRVRVAARASRRTVPSLLPQLGDAHALRHPPLRAEGLARCEAGGHRRHPARLGLRARGDARGVPEGRRAAVGGARRLVPRGARGARAPRADRLRVPLRPRRVVGRALRGQGRRQGRLPHARRDALRRDRPGAADPLGARGSRAGTVVLAGALGRSHADAARARRASRRETRRRVAAAARPRRRGGRSPGDRRRHRHGCAHEARACACRRGS